MTFKLNLFLNPAVASVFLMFSIAEEEKHTLTTFTIKYCKTYM